jgi:hypothetical protein
MTFRGYSYEKPFLWWLRAWKPPPPPVTEEQFLQVLKEWGGRGGTVRWESSPIENVPKSSYIENVPRRRWWERKKGGAGQPPPPPPDFG